jgi:hypothetical protein
VCGGCERRRGAEQRGGSENTRRQTPAQGDLRPAKTRQNRPLTLSVPIKQREGGFEKSLEIMNRVQGRLD